MGTHTHTHKDMHFQIMCALSHIHVRPHTVTLILHVPLPPHHPPTPQDPRYSVTYYYNTLTGKTTYDEPTEYTAWEKRYNEWVTAIMRQGMR